MASDREKFIEWAKATGQLCVRGGFLAVLIYVGVMANVADVSNLSPGAASPALFDAIFTVGSAKVFVVGALFSLGASWLSGRVGDKSRPTV